MTASSWTIAALTAVLVIVTGFYAWQTRRTVDELRKARAVAVRPHLALRLHEVDPTVTFVQVINVGSGPALDVEVEVRFVALSDTSEAVESSMIQEPAMAPGEFLDAIPMGPGQQVLNTAALAARVARIELRGTMVDAFGTPYPVEDTLTDLAAWRSVRLAASIHWTDSIERRLAQELGKELDRVGEVLAAAIRVR